MTLITFEEAVAAVRSAAVPMGSEVVGLDGLVGRVLAEDVLSPHDVPYFDNSAVDGYALAEPPAMGAPIRLTGELAAGDSTPIAVSSGEAVRVSTGSRLPEGACAVAMQEHASLLGSTVVLNKPIRPGSNIRRKGEEISSGMAVLRSGYVLNPPSVSLLASLGFDSALVAQKPRVGVIGTGSELRQPGASLDAGAIFESNRQGIEAASRSYGLDIAFSRHVPDSWEAVQSAIADAAQSCDLIVTSGGASVGGHDYAVEAACSQGFELRFHGVSMKPGKPTFFMVRGRQLLVGMPGNPVPALLGFELFVRPALLRMFGIADDPVVHALLLEDLEKEAGRTEFVRSSVVHTVDGLAVKPIERRGSHMLGGLSDAQAVIVFPKEETKMGAGTNCQIIPLRWRLAG